MGLGDGCMAIYGAPRMSSHSRAMHMHVLEGHVHCISHFGIVTSWGSGVLVSAIHKGIASCVFARLECGLFGVRYYCVRLCGDLLCVG